MKNWRFENKQLMIMIMIMIMITITIPITITITITITIQIAITITITITIKSFCQSESVEKWKKGNVTKRKLEYNFLTFKLFTFMRNLIKTINDYKQILKIPPYTPCPGE